MKYSRSLVATLLMSGGLLQLTPLALAAPTAAGTGIENTATATYEDPSGAVSNTTSNTVTVTVAEIAGITITSTSVLNTGTTAPVNTGSQTGITTAAPKGNDNLIFEFNITNTGNDATDFRVPNQAQVGSSPITVSKVQYFDKGDNTWKDVNTVNNIIKKDSTDDGDITPGKFVRIRVLATVNAGTTSGNISLTLGNTGATNQQNIALDTNSGGDVYTVDKADASSPNEVSGAPSNGVREAAASASPTVISPPAPTGKQALVKVTKVAILPITDDKVTYTLGVDVADTPGNSGILTADLTDLAGTKIDLDGTIATRILVSDAVPTGTLLTAKPVIPPSLEGWTVVYTVGTIGATAANDSSVQWKTWDGNTAPVLNTTLGGYDTVTRIGFVKTGTILKGAGATGFTMTVKLNLPAAGGSRRNIAQVFGSTLVDGSPDFTKPSVDESGDGQYNNLNSDGTAGPAPTNGVATTTDGVDTFKNNTGSGPGGEDTVVTVSPEPVTLTGGLVGVLNGTKDQPGSVGPLGNNDDFTNKSVTVDTTRAKWVNGVPTKVNAQSIGFTNTVSLLATATRDQYVILLPTAPLNKADLPNDSTVKIIYGGVTVIYTYNNVTGVFTPTPAVLNGPAPAPIRLTVPKGGKVSYGVEIDLPETEQFKGYPVSITAFTDGAPSYIDTDGNALTAIAGDGLLDNSDAQNITIDRIYTGYLKLEKEAQVYKVVDGVTTVVSPFGSTAAKAAPGEYIEYRIKYRNISEPVPTDSYSIGLTAKNINILENGAPNTVTGTNNNWAVSTEHKPGSGLASAGTIEYEAGNKTNSDLTVGSYLNNIPSLLPDAVGQFTFTRRVKLVAPVVQNN